ncbi:MAG TPA: hypothetical protein VD997_03360 [Phycisphaerales bacterium]|nr:hypothetical protein [Phycisphaerales bacterium]
MRSGDNQPQAAGLGGLIHTYLAFDPKNFPSPTAPPPDLTSAAFEHMLAFGSMRHLTEEELARAIHLDPSMFPRLGPSLDQLMAMLAERKRKILETYETEQVQQSVAKAFEDAASTANPPPNLRDALTRMIRDEQLADLERLYFRQKDDTSDFARQLMSLMHRLGEKYQVDELAAKYEFTGRTPMTVPQALEIKDELETIDKLLEQLKEASKTAQLAIIDMDELSEFADDSALEDLNKLQEQIEDYLREQARAQGLEFTREGYRLTPQAFRVFQRKLLQEIFSELTASRSGRHTGPVVGEGAVEIERTKEYEFGDSVAHMDIVQTVINGVARERAKPPAQPGSQSQRLHLSMDDITIHRTRNNPKCATMVLMDMSGSMRYDGQYINVKRMALALDGLIRAEYPGDFLGFVEMFTFAKRRQISELPALMPKPVSVHSPVVRLKADMSNPDVSELRVPQHFTNIQHALAVSRQVLSVQDTPNRQVILITDGLPTAHFDGPELYMLYPPDPRTEEATMREAMLCSRDGITINIFLLPNWSQTSEDVAFAQRMAEATRGRVFFTGGRDLDRYVVWDYVKQRRKVIG